MSFIPLYQQRSITESFKDTFRFLIRDALPLWIGILGIYAALYGIRYIIDNVAIKILNDEISHSRLYGLFTLIWDSLEISVLSCVLYNYVIQRSASENFKDDDYSFLKINIQNCLGVFLLYILLIFFYRIIQVIFLLSFYFELLPSNLILITNASVSATIGKLILMPFWGVGVSLILVNQYSNIKETLVSAFSLSEGYRLHFVAGVLGIYSFYIAGDYFLMYSLDADLLYLKSVFYFFLFIIPTVFFLTYSIFVYGSVIKTNAEVIPDTDISIDSLIDSLGK